MNQIKGIWHCLYLIIGILLWLEIVHWIEHSFLMDLIVDFILRQAQ